MLENPEREVPFHFSNPSGQVCPESTQLPYPMGIANLLHEVELIVAVGKNDTNFPASEALDYIFSYAVGLDLARRDKQKGARKRQDLVLQPKVLTDLLLVLICIRWRKLVT
jgi:fumarylpyruvate hydrolase